MVQAPQNSAGLPAILAQLRPQAYAAMAGSPQYPKLRGMIRFYPMRAGVIVTADIAGMPVPQDPCANTVHALHIHAGGRCSGTADDPFADAGGHYNPGNCPHPAHAGDLPPLFFTRDGRAWSATLTSRFTLPQILGKTVILHSGPDDFTTQPSGNSGAMIACGVILPTR